MIKVYSVLSLVHIIFVDLEIIASQIFGMDISLAKSLEIIISRYLLLDL